MDKKTGSSPLTLTIFGLVLHSRLFIEIQLNEFMLVKLDKIINPTKNTFFSSNNCNILYVINISSIVINTKMIDISIKPCFFSYYLLSSLLKRFLSLMELPQFQNLLP